MTANSIETDRMIDRSIDREQFPKTSCSIKMAANSIEHDCQKSLSRLKLSRIPSNEVSQSIERLSLSSDVTLSKTFETSQVCPIDRGVEKQRKLGVRGICRARIRVARSMIGARDGRKGSLLCTSLSRCRGESQRRDNGVRFNKANVTIVKEGSVLLAN